VKKEMMEWSIKFPEWGVPGTGAGRLATTAILKNRENILKPGYHIFVAILSKHDLEKYTYPFFVAKIRQIWEDVEGSIWCRVRWLGNSQNMFNGQHREDAADPEDNLLLHGHPTIAPVPLLHWSSNLMSDSKTAASGESGDRPIYSYPLLTTSRYLTQEVLKLLTNDRRVAAHLPLLSLDLFKDLRSKWQLKVQQEQKTKKKKKKGKKRKKPGE
jgi:hypothetical protein